MWDDPSMDVVALVVSIGAVLIAGVSLVVSIASARRDRTRFDQEQSDRDRAKVRWSFSGSRAFLNAVGDGPESFRLRFVNEGSHDAALVQFDPSELLGAMVIDGDAELVVKQGDSIELEVTAESHLPEALTLWWALDTGDEASFSQSVRVEGWDRWSRPRLP